VLSKLLFGLQLQATCWYHAQCMLPRAYHQHHVHATILSTVFPSHESPCIFFPARYEDRRNHKLVTINFQHCCSMFQQEWKIAFCLQNAYEFQSTWIHFFGLNEVHTLQCQTHPQQEISGLPTNMVRKKFNIPWSSICQHVPDKGWVCPKTSVNDSILFGHPVFAHPNDNITLKSNATTVNNNLFSFHAQTLA
jgi:hypothetical protein